MINKITFLCVTPLEGFLSQTFQGCAREYYQWLYGEALRKEVNLQCRECIEVYGEPESETRQELFEQTLDRTQLLYVQSQRKEVVKEVFEKSDLVIMGIPGCKREFDKIFMLVFPWKDQVLFFWDWHICRGEKYIRQLCNEYKLREEQMIEVKRNPYGKVKI